jgi:hypothetical protein
MAKRRNNPAGIPTWMWLVGAAGAYWWYKNRAPVVKKPPVIGPEELQRRAEERQELLEGTGFICFGRRC